MNPRICALFVFAAIVSGCSGPPSSVEVWLPLSDLEADADRPARAVTRIPIAVEDRHPVVDAMIDGVPVRLLVDLGAAETIALSESAAERVGARRIGGVVKIASALGDVHRAWPIAVDEVVLGDPEKPGHAMVAQKVVGIASTGYGSGPVFEDIEGIVGRGLLLASPVFFTDFAADGTSAEIGFVTDAGFEIPARYPVIDARLEPEYGVVSDLRFGGESRSRRVLWDTGATANVMNASAVGELPTEFDEQFGVPVVRALDIGGIATTHGLAARFSYDPRDFYVLDMSVLPFDALLGLPTFTGRLHLFARETGSDEMKIGLLPSGALRDEDIAPAERSSDPAP